jgi:hypothetical protein
MPQTTSSVPIACAYVGISTNSDCSAFTDVSGSVNSVTGIEQPKAVADEYTLEGETAISEVGKRQPADLVVRCVFNAEATEAYRIAREAFRESTCDGRVCLRVIPGGATAGNEGWQTNYAPVIRMMWPDVNAAQAGPAMAEFTVHAADVDPFVFAS